MLENKKAVIFDLDGTLADSMWVWDEIDEDFFGSRNLTPPHNFLIDIEGMSFTETADHFIKTFHLTESIEELKSLWNQAALDKYRHKVSLKRGALDFLKQIRENGYKTGIASSNSPELVQAFLDAQKLHPYIDVITTSCEVEKGKPAPDVYLETASRLEVLPSDCLVFEDVPAGIIAGKTAGMNVCAVFDIASESQNSEKMELADYYIEDFTEVL